jgi:predicted kinase
MNKPTLILTVGLPRSGKSTWAREYDPYLQVCSQQIATVNPDSIRLTLHGTAFRREAEGLVWSIAHVMVESLFLAGHNTVILDACNHTARRRNEWLSDKWDCRYVEFPATMIECIRRAEANNQQYLIPVIQRMSEEITWPNKKETTNV